MKLAHIQRNLMSCLPAVLCTEPKLSLEAPAHIMPAKSASRPHSSTCSEADAEAKARSQHKYKDLQLPKPASRQHMVPTPVLKQ